MDNHTNSFSQLDYEGTKETLESNNYIISLLINFY